MFHPLISATLGIGHDRLFLFPPFADARHKLTATQLSSIRKAGFDFVRLPVDPGPFLQFQGGKRDALDDIMRQRVQTILDAGLGVVVDFHPNPSSVDYAPKSLVQGIDSPLFQTYCTMLARTARLLDGMHTKRVALELMNEPAAGWSAAGYADWHAMLEKAYRTLRTDAPRLALVLSGGSNGDIEGLTNLDPRPFASDQAVIFTFHFYDPYIFTEQSGPASPANPLRNLELDVPYPASARPVDDSIDALSAWLERQHVPKMARLEDMALVRTRLTAYRLTGFNRATIKASFDSVTSWARANAISPSRIFLGEFGVPRRYGAYHGAREMERIRWLSDVRSEAEAHGFFWSIWTYSGSGGMAIVNVDVGGEIDPGTLNALGLR